MNWMDRASWIATFSQSLAEYSGEPPERFRSVAAERYELESDFDPASLARASIRAREADGPQLPLSFS